MFASGSVQVETVEYRVGIHSFGGFESTVTTAAQLSFPGHLTLFLAVFDAFSDAYCAAMVM